MKKRKFHHYFVPQRHNNYKPYLLRMEGVFVFGALMFCVWGGMTYVERLITTSNNSTVAAVVSSVLADLANSDREANGLFGLQVSNRLTRAAQMKADDMARASYFAHTAPDGTEPWHWFEKAGYSFAFAGENLAVFFSDSDAVERAWMNSPTHRANILDPHFTEVGIAMANGMYQGRPTVFVVQEFGTPREVERVVEPVVTTEPEQIAVESVPVTRATTTAPVQKTIAPRATSTPKTVPLKPKIITKTDTYISVEGVPLVAGTSSQQATEKPDTLSALIWRIVASPRTTLSWVFFWISVLILFAMLVIIVVEAERKHWMGVVYGIALLILMVGLVVVDHVYLAGQLLVV